MKKVARLVSQFKPENYQLDLVPNRENKTFSGKVTILGQKVGKPNQRITLHQKGLNINQVKITYTNKKGDHQQIEVSRINTHKSYDELRLHSSQILYPGKYQIIIEFSGKITDQMHGMYPCYFADRKKQLIATQFESHHAREVFPCIDEPVAKASFDLTITTPKNETVLANTPIAKQLTKSDELLTTFETTPIMSTYLLAFVYGDLAYKEAKTTRGIAVRSYATPENSKLLDFSVDVGVKCIDFFESYFGVDYPLPKLDMVALPDFSSGAMENWGLVTFRESVLLADPKNTSIETKQSIALVVAHELAHQWFGNLVTMAWWDDLWLNESFANLMEYRAVDELFPDWNIWEMFVNRELGLALRRDSLPNVQAVHCDVNHPDELGALFDPAIVYAKGGSLLNMLRNMVGEDSFKKGLTDYFKKHAYGNTVADDLWASLGKAHGQDLSKFMNDWLNRPGYPVVTLDYQPGTKLVKLSQKRLVIGNTELTKSKPWNVPLAASADLQNDLLETDQDEFKLKNVADSLLLDHDGHSYFVANYPNPLHRQQIVSNIKDGLISTIDRLQLLQHSSLLEKALVIKTTDSLDFLEAYVDETEEAVWSAMMSIVGDARRLVSGDEAAEQRLNKFVAKLVQPLVNKLGWASKPSDSAQTLRLRSQALTVAAAANVQSVIKEASARFKEFKTPDQIVPELREVVFFVAARYGTDADFNKLLNAYSSTDSADEKDEVASGLTSAKDPARVAKLLALLTTPTVRSQDLPHWFAWLMFNQHSRSATWDWLTTNWEFIESLYSSDKSFDVFPRYAAASFSRPQELKKYQDFFGKKQDVIALQRNIVLGIEEIQGKIAWRKNNEVSVKTWLATKYK